MGYREIWARQRKIHAEVAAGERGDTVLFVQHEPVYTAGRRTLPRERPADGTPVVDVDRGGKITYHGPGQLVCYPILRLPEHFGIDDYVRFLEEASIAVVKKYGVETALIPGKTGVWVKADARGGDRKICALGIRVVKRVSFHGLALNVGAGATGPFSNIIPCGLVGVGVTSIETETGTAPNLEDVAKAFETQLKKIRNQPGLGIDRRQSIDS